MGVLYLLNNNDFFIFLLYCIGLFHMLYIYTYDNMILCLFNLDEIIYFFIITSFLGISLSG